MPYRAWLRAWILEVCVVGRLVVFAALAACSSPKGGGGSSLADSGSVGSTTPSGTSGTDTTQTGSTAPPSRVYLTFVSHNEDTATGDNPSCSALRDAIDTRWEPQRQALLDIANLVDAYGAAWSFQSDVEFVDFTLAREAPDDNIIRTLAEWPSGRISVEAHAHEGPGKNYADVANRLQAASGQINGVVGGFTAAPCPNGGPQPDWEKFRQPLAPLGLGPSWQATILTDSATPGHCDDPAVSAAGVWRPRAEDDFFTDDPTQDLINIGVGLEGHGLDDGLVAIETLVDDLRSGRLEPGRMYTSNITLPQCDFDLAGTGFEPADIEAFFAAVDALIGGQDDVRWATFPEIARIWREEYGSQPSVWRGQGN